MAKLVSAMRLATVHNLMRAAISQPTYMPWSGYFGLISAVDVFVFLDSVQFAHRSWQHRNRIQTADGALTLSVPVLTKGRARQDIMDVEIDFSRDYPERHIRALKYSYGKAHYFNKFAPILFDILEKKQTNLVDLNLDIITWLLEILNIQTKLLRSSELQSTGAKAALLANICADIGSIDTYISTIGAQEYLDASHNFEDKKISVRYFEFTHEPYKQRFSPFAPSLSIMDLLFNTGSEYTKSYITEHFVLL